MISRLDMPSAIHLRGPTADGKRWVMKLKEATEKAPDMTKVLSHQSIRSMTSEEAETFHVGARVKVFSRTLNGWQPGVVGHHEPDGLIRVNYGDGFRTKKSVDPRDADSVRINSDEEEEDTDEDGSEISSLRSSMVENFRDSFLATDNEAFVPFDVVFTEPGPLGMSFACEREISEGGRPWIKAIKPDSQAARFPQLVSGLSLLSVNGEQVECLIDTVEKIKASGRPATLQFERQQAGTEEERSVQRFLLHFGCHDTDAVVAAFTSADYLPSTWITELEQMLSSGDLGSFLDCLSAAHRVPKHVPDAQGSDYRVVFTDPGSLGIAFGSDSAQGLPFIKSVRPDTQAARLPQLKLGLFLECIDNEKVLSFSDAVSRLKSVGRPVTLVFRDAPEEQDAETAEREVAEFLDRAGVAVHPDDVVEAFDAAGFLPATWLPELQDMQKRDELAAFLSSVATDESEPDPVRDVQKFLTKICMGHASARVIDAFVSAEFESSTWVAELEDMEQSGDLEMFVESLGAQKRTTEHTAGQAVQEVSVFLKRIGVTTGVGTVVDEFVAAGYEPSVRMQTICRNFEFLDDFWKISERLLVLSDLG